MLSANHRLTPNHRVGRYQSFFDSNFKDWSAPFTAMYFCNFHGGTIDHVSESIKDICGYQNHYFTDNGIKAFLKLIPFQDRMALIRLCMSLGNEEYWSDTLNSDTPTKSLRIQLRHFNGNQITVEMVLMVLDYCEQGAIGRVFGAVKICSEPDFKDWDLSRQTKRISSDNFDPKQLKVSRREQQVLRLIAHGYSSKMVADKLCISIHTAARHRTNLLEKFRAKNTAELVLLASRKYWL